MADQLQVIRGMHDILPADMPVWYRLEDEYRMLVESYGYRQIRTPLSKNGPVRTFHRRGYRYRRKGNVQLRRSQWR